jgi:hypothetical protein
MWVRTDDNTQDHTFASNAAAFDPNANLLWFRDDANTTPALTNTVAAIVGTDPRGIAANNSFNDTNWHLVALTFETGVADGEKIFIDGERSSGATGNSTGETLSTATSIQLGNISADHGNQLEGHMDEVGFWDRQINPAEMRALFFLADDPNTVGNDFVGDTQDAAVLFDFYEQGADGDELLLDGLLYTIVPNVAAFGGIAGESVQVGNDLVLGLDDPGTGGLFATTPLQAVPEPASIAAWLLVSAIGLVILWRRRRE